MYNVLRYTGQEPLAPSAILTKLSEIAAGDKVVYHVGEHTSTADKGVIARVRELHEGKRITLVQRRISHDLAIHGQFAYFAVGIRRN
ncbi:MAG: hypothetical protein KBC16_01980 [Candidatus Pacebacteria bacterium]|nr:hypothetical protein [Candidatus Paceibacterota bacterium]